MMAPRPIGDRPMTVSERVARHRHSRLAQSGEHQDGDGGVSAAD